MFVTENTKRSSVEKEPLRFSHRQSNPTRRQYAAEVPMREEPDIPMHRPKPSDEPISTVGDPGRSFAAWAAISKQVPAWMLPADIIGTPSFVFTIVPLDKVGIDGCEIAQTG